MASLQKIVSFLDQEMKLDEWSEDSSLNGLQFEGRAEVRRIGATVDACGYSFHRAAAQRVDFLLVHHGLFWKPVRKIDRFVGAYKKTIQTLYDNEMSVYACHLPLDAHPKYGNNVLIAKAVGLLRIKPFVEYAGKPIGYYGELAKPIALNALAAKVSAFCGGKANVLDYGKKVIRRVGVVSGAASEAYDPSIELGLDVLITGEVKQSSARDARDGELSVIAGGHYNTETVGVRALSKVLAQKFGLQNVFVDAQLGV